MTFLQLSILQKNTKYQFYPTGFTSSEIA